VQEKRVDEHVIESQHVFTGRILNVRIDTVRMNGDRTARREVVEHADAVVILPVAADGRIVFVRQYRLPARKALLELPAGTLDEDESPEVGAQRELREETGWRAARLRRLCGFYPAPGYSEEYMHVYVAEDLAESRLEPDEDEDLAVELYTLPEALAMIASGAIEDGKTIVGLLAYAREVGA